MRTPYRIDLSRTRTGPQQAQTRCATLTQAQDAAEVWAHRGFWVRIVNETNGKEIGPYAPPPSEPDHE